MTVQELIGELAEMNPEAEVRIAYQPNYPMECETPFLVSEGVVDGHNGEVVYIAQRRSGGDSYLDSEAREKLGW